MIQLKSEISILYHLRNIFSGRHHSCSMLFQCPGCDREKGERRKKSELFRRTISVTLIGQCVTIPPSDWSLATHLDWWDPQAGVLEPEPDFPSPLWSESPGQRWPARAAHLTGGCSLPTRLKWETAAMRRRRRQIFLGWHSTLVHDIWAWQIV